MHRVLVMGCSGAGKTTFARSLADKLALPFVSLDRLYWQPGWREPNPNEFAARVAREAEQPAWVMDGNYLAHGASVLRRARADTIFWFDLPRRTCMRGVVWRIITGYGVVRSEMAPGCPEKLDWTFLRYVWTYRAAQRPKLAAFLAARPAQQQLVTFVTRAQVRDFLTTLQAA